MFSGRERDREEKKETIEIEFLFNLLLWNENYLENITPVFFFYS